jgi:opine dehydrogenase
MQAGETMADRYRYVVIGAGNGGCAMAAELSLMGREVVLYEHPEFRERLSAIRDAGGIMVESRTDNFGRGRGEHFAPLTSLATDPAAMADADVVIVVVPGQHQQHVIDVTLPHLRPGQLVLVNPGGVGGVLVWRRALATAGIEGVMLAQPSDLLYAGSRLPDARVVIGDKKRKAILGVLPNADRDRVFGILAQDFPEFVPAENVLVAGLSGPGMLVHPLPMLMNAVRIDRETPFRYDSYDITPSIARAVEALDRERMDLISALGGSPVPIKDVLTEYYGATGADFYETVQNVGAYRNAAAPPNFRHRYVTEEVPTHLVPSVAIGQALGVPTPVMQATAVLAGAVAGEDFSKTGWTLDALGLAGLDRSAILGLLEAGGS